MMKLLSLVIGFGLGAAVGAALVMLFAPSSGEQLARALQQHVAHALEAGRQAAAQRRAELEAELEHMQSKRPALPEQTSSPDEH